MRVIGIDYGEKRVGIALSDPMQIIATPKTIIKHDNDDLTVINSLLEIIDKNNVGKVVVGLPLNMNGSHGFQAERVCQFVEELKNYISIPIIFEDERESSKLAKETIKTIKAKESRVDDRAAAVILQNYLDYN